MATSAFRILAAFGLSGFMFAMQTNSAHAQQIRPRLQPVVRAPATAPAAEEREITPPPSLAIQARPDAVILKAGSSSTILRALRVKRQIPIATLRTQPVITLGKARVNMTPVFRNTASLINVAGRLKSQPSLVQVIAEDTQVLEVDQGLIIRQYLSYRTKPGVCTNPAGRTQLERNGGGCFSRLTGAAKAAAFANPRDPRYIADPGKRAKAVSAAEQEAAAEQKEFADGVAEFRSMMRDPARRAQVEAELGASEAARLNALGDDQLQEELVNSADIQIEDVMFVPAADKLDLVPKDEPKKSRFQLPPVPEKVDVEHALKQNVFLTGFTLGRGNEWSRRVSVTVKMCVLGCKKTYYVELYAGFGYGFGVRFPIRMAGLYAYHRAGDTETASITPTFEPINGNDGDYAATGLPGDKIFKGKEVVAELTAYAGIRYKIPFHSDSLRAEAGKDLTEGLPPPFTGGQFRPPAPGASNALNTEAVFDNPDLLGGLANLGFIGAKILPAVRVGLSSDRLRLKLTDNLSGKTSWMENSGQTYPLAIDPKDHASSFSIGYPDYNLAFALTPGLAARLFVDVSVWSHNWDWPVWFPDMTVTLPPDGYTFTCHANTVCSRDYRYSPTLTQETAEAPLDHTPDAMELKTIDWKKDFVRRWARQCPYEPIHVCETAIKAVAFTTSNRMLNEFRALPSYPSAESTVIIVKKSIEADKTAKQIILDNKVAAVRRYGKKLFKTYEAAWHDDCADQLCRDRIHALGEQFALALANRQKSNPPMAVQDVITAEGKQGNWIGRCKQEIEASRNRIRPRTPIRRI